MIPIQVLGTGLIPRGYGLAPRVEPFKADKTLIWTIMQAPGLTINFINPETGAPTRLTKDNLDRIYTKWANYNPKKPAPQTIQTRPVAPVKPANPVKAQATSFPEKTNPNEVPEQVNTVKDNLGEIKGAFEVPAGDLNNPDTIDPSQIPEDMAFGLPADPNEPADGEAVLITVTEDGSEVTELPEEPIDTTGYRMPDVVGSSESIEGEHKATESYNTAMDQLHGESASDEKPATEPDAPAPETKKVSFKPILNDDEDDRGTPVPKQGNNHKNKHKHH